MGHCTKVDDNLVAKSLCLYADDFVSLFPAHPDVSSGPEQLERFAGKVVKHLSAELHLDTRASFRSSVRPSVRPSVKTRKDKS